MPQVRASVHPKFHHVFSGIHFQNPENNFILKDIGFIILLISMIFKALSHPYQLVWLFLYSIDFYSHAINLVFLNNGKQLWSINCINHSKSSL